MPPKGCQTELSKFTTSKPSRQSLNTSDWSEILHGSLIYHLEPGNQRKKWIWALSIFSIRPTQGVVVDHRDVPGKRIGLLIGHGGGTIRTIQAESGASVMVNNPNDEGKQTVTITGQQKAVEKAKNLIDLKIQPSVQYGGLVRKAPPADIVQTSRTNVSPTPLSPGHPACH